VEVVGFAAKAVDEARRGSTALEDAGALAVLLGEAKGETSGGVGAGRGEVGCVAMKATKLRRATAASEAMR
jgi:hypothetical protein